MAYYDQLVEDPQAALREIASLRNLTPEEFSRRIDSISAEAVSGRHLTLGQLKGFAANPDGADRDAASHLNACIYCQGMVDALSPKQIESNLRTVKEKILKGDGSPAAQETYAFASADAPFIRAAHAAPQRRGSYLGAGAVAATFLGAICAALFSGVYAYKSRNQITLLKNEVNNLSARNDLLVVQMADTKERYLAALGNHGKMVEHLVANSDSFPAALAGMKVTMPSEPVMWYASDGKHVYVPKCPAQVPNDPKTPGQVPADGTTCELVVAASNASPAR